MNLLYYAFQRLFFAIIYSILKKIMKKIISLLLVSFLTMFSMQAKDTAVDYVKLAREGTAEEIKDAVKSDSRLYTRLFGSNRENFLMLLLHGNRSLDIIKLGVMSGIDVTTLSKDGRSSVMYACRYVTDPKAVKYIIKSGTVFGIGIKDRLTRKDDAGKSCFDYVKDNPNYTEVYPVLTSFTDDPEVLEKKQQEKEAAKKAKKEADAARKAELEKQQKEESVTEENSEIEESSVLTAGGNSPEAELQPEAEDNAEEIRRVSSSPSDKVTYTVTPVIVTETLKNENVSSSDAAEQKTETSAQTEVPEVSKTSSDGAKTVQAETVKRPADSYKTYKNTYLYDFALTSEEVAPEEEKKPFTVPEPDAADRNGVTLLMKAAKAGNDWDVENLLKSGADPNLRDKDGWSALMYACRYQNSLSIVTKLIDKGAHIRVRNKYNATPLLMASDYSQNPQILKVLLKDRNITEDEVYRAFIMTVTSNQGEKHIKEAKMQVFLDMDIPLNRLWKGKTPLMYAAQYGTSTHTIKLLMDKGAKPGIQDHDGKTAFDYAKLNSNLTHDDIYWSLNSSAR